MRKYQYKGKLITFEGSEGSGKSTQIELVRRFLKHERQPVLFIREPGGTVISEKIRDILLDVGNASMGQNCEMLLYMAARAQLVHEQILPALKQGKIVLCDRFLDSTLVYQGHGHGMNLNFIRLVGEFATQGVVPDITFFFDIDAKEGLSRLKRPKDRIERRSLDYHNRVRKGYRGLARQFPKRIKLIKVNCSIEEVHGQVLAFLKKILKK